MTGKPRQPNETIALSLARGRSRAMAAREAGCSVRTVDRRLADPEFRLRVSRLRTDLVDQATGTLAEAAQAAAETLVCLLGCASPAIALGAARAILDGLTRLREHAELAARIDELEERIDGHEEPTSET